MTIWARKYLGVTVCLPALAISTWAEGGLEYFKSLQEVRREIFNKTAPAVVRVELVHRSMPAYLLSSLDRCASECEFKPWQRGEISGDEAAMWQQWCRSFMDFSQDKFRATLQSETDTVVWHDSLETAFQDWLTHTRQDLESSQGESLERFSQRLNEHITALAEDLKLKGAVSPKPMVRDQSTGVVIRKGIVVTTHNAARGNGPQDWIRVWSDKLVAYSTGELVGSDPDTNLAVIRLSGPGSELEPIGRIEADHQPRVGDFAFFLYHPFNQGLSMQSGEITSLYNRLPFFNCAAFHSTSFPTSPGTLGGPVVDLDGNLIGINTLYMGQGNMSEITYTLPSGNVLACVDQIMDKGYVERGRLGVYLSEFNCPVGQHVRVSVMKVLPGSVADLMGIHKGDIINSINGKSVNCRMELVSQLYQTPPEKPVQLEIERGGQVQEIQLSLSAPAKAANDSSQAADFNR